MPPLACTAQIAARQPEFAPDLRRADLVENPLRHDPNIVLRHAEPRLASDHSSTALRHSVSDSCTKRPGSVPARVSTTRPCRATMASICGRHASIHSGARTSSTAQLQGVRCAIVLTAHTVPGWRMSAADRRRTRASPPALLQHDETLRRAHAGLPSSSLPPLRAKMASTAGSAAAPVARRSQRCGTCGRGAAELLAEVVEDQGGTGPLRDMCARTNLAMLVPLTASSPSRSAQSSPSRRARRAAWPAGAPRGSASVLAWVMRNLHASQPAWCTCR